MSAEANAKSTSILDHHSAEKPTNTRVMFDDMDKSDSIPDKHKSVPFKIGKLKSKLTDAERDELIFSYPDINGNLDHVPRISERAKSSSSFITSMITTLVFMLLLWQTSNNISNNALGVLLGFLQQYFGILAMENEIFLTFAAILPSSIYAAFKYIGLDKIMNDFDRYVPCTHCNKVRLLKDCYTTDRHGNNIPLKCNAAIYKGNTYKGKCCAELLQTVITSKGNKVLIPRKVFARKSITDQIEAMFSRNGYEDLCNAWRHQDPLPDYYSDVYSGKIWAEMQKKHKLFKNPHDLGLKVNTDFFQPHKHRNQSIGVIYMTVLNLPRQIRYDLENVILAGIIPSMDWTDEKGKFHVEPKSLDPFLSPIIDELEALERGVKIITKKFISGVPLRAMVIMASCDGPAARKLLGFLAHSALKGCVKCTKVFPGKVGEKYYGGFNDAAPKRTGYSHRNHCNEIRNSKNCTEWGTLETKYGCRPSEMLRLTYFDPIRMNVIDPMHCLFLGLAKSFFRKLVEKNILTDEKLADLDRNVKTMFNPFSTTWLPKHIHSNWKNYNAHEWMQWTLIYSIPTFTGVLPRKYLDLWQKFVKACNLICRPIVHKDDAKKAQELLIEYGKQFESMFGRNAVPPNMHFATHIVECMEEFGSMYTFWCFGMERLNGFLGDYTTNSQCIEVTITRKFLGDCYLASRSHEIPKFFKEHFPAFFSKAVSMQISKPLHLPKRMEILGSLPIAECNHLWKTIGHVSSKGKEVRYLLDIDDRILLMNSYKAMYPHNYISIEDVYEMCFEVDTLLLGSQRLSCRSKHESKRCIVTANWCDNDGNITTDLNDIKPGQVNFFLKHNLNLNGQIVTHYMCALNWYTEFTDDSYNHGQLYPSFIYRPCNKILAGPATFMPVQRIQSVCAYCIRTLNGFKNCTVASPVKLNIYAETECIL